ncbi:hypothetical protein [Aggregatibacter kilianii]|uniref:hypothetical protein n=1 Tax=Aggregatibacter kilianii TaxID=2025884 RepID=UPI0013A61876|nr:hypothetical protein [Aggregatibacter kilianii]
MKKLLLSFILFVTAFMLNGCTKLLWQDFGETKTEVVHIKTQQDDLDAFGIIKDKQNPDRLVMTGGFWYVIDPEQSKILLPLLTRNKLSRPLKLVEYRSHEGEYRATDRIRATLNRKDSTFSAYVCLGYKPHSDADVKQLKKLDFNFDEKSKFWGNCFHANGKVYMKLDSVKADTPLRIKVPIELELVDYKTKRNFDGLDTKVILTPLTLAFDAVFYSLGGIETLVDKEAEK